MRLCVNDKGWSNAFNKARMVGYAHIKKNVNILDVSTAKYGELPCGDIWDFFTPPSLLV